jgi:hypothetical protein
MMCVLTGLSALKCQPAFWGYKKLDQKTNCFSTLQRLSPILGAHNVLSPNTGLVVTPLSRTSNFPTQTMSYKGDKRLKTGNEGVFR